MKATQLFVSMAIGVASMTAQAALLDRGGGMIYDSVMDITWLQDWNVNGRMNWATANSWANNLVYGGYDDWRLPLVAHAAMPCPVTIYFGCTDSEMGNMFYNYLGGQIWRSVLDQTDGDTAEQMANLVLFKDIHADVYWSGTELDPQPTFPASFVFYFFNGSQYDVTQSYEAYALAVRPGDVVADVPEPATGALLLAGLLGLAKFRRHAIRQRPL